MKNLNLIPAAKDEDYTYLIIAQYLSHLTLFLKTGTSYEGRWEIFSRSFPLHLQQFSPFNLVGQGFMRLLVATNSSLRLEIKSHLFTTGSGTLFPHLDGNQQITKLWLVSWFG